MACLYGGILAFRYVLHSAIDNTEHAIPTWWHHGRYLTTLIESEENNMHNLH